MTTHLGMRESDEVHIRKHDLMDQSECLIKKAEQRHRGAQDFFINLLRDRRPSLIQEEVPNEIYESGE